MLAVHSSFSSNSWFFAISWCMFKYWTADCGKGCFWKPGQACAMEPWRELKVREGGSVRSSPCPDYRLTGWRGSVFLPCWLTELPFAEWDKAEITEKGKQCPCCCLDIIYLLAKDRTHAPGCYCSRREGGWLRKLVKQHDTSGWHQFEAYYQNLEFIRLIETLG